LASQVTAEISPSSLERPTAKPKIAIVIDDLGDSSKAAKQIMQLPGQFTLAIMPHTPHAKNISVLGSEKGHDVIVHLPMESLSDKSHLLGKGAILTSMSRGELEKSFFNSIDSVPNAIGFNNHMGSLLTQDSLRMNWLMQIAADKGWYFVDSKTSSQSVATQVAKKLRLPIVSRDIFLDHHNHDSQLPKILAAQLKKAKAIAQKQGDVVIICHPYPQTLTFLTEVIPGLMDEFELVGISQLIKG
jgi:polysaccharide deacetylase 2 family uncharacterized protein YibQ